MSPIITLSDISEADDNLIEHKLKFPDVSISYWGYADIVKGVERGYVNGLPDGTFAPDKPVSRAEFIKMVVAAMKIPVGEAKPGTVWYMPYTTAARQYGLISDNEYENDNFTQPMTRLEMAKVAVRAVNKNASYDEAFMLVATENGLIMGTGDGSLRPEGTTTRAQSVTIVERVLKVRAGETLPRDEKAVENARDYATIEQDPWGREIRKTDLPKNADQFPYILKDLPNEFYEMPFVSMFNKFRDPVEVTTSPLYSVEAVRKLADKLEGHYHHLLNIDYNTIDYTWAEKFVENAFYSGSKDLLLSRAMEYVDWVKKNEIKVVGKVTFEPSAFYASPLATMRGVLEFRIESLGDGVDKEEETPIFWQSFNRQEFYKDIGNDREYYVDVGITATPGSPDYSWYSPTAGSELFRNYMEGYR